MGIETDWNCAISLRPLEDSTQPDPHRMTSSYADWDVKVMVIATVVCLVFVHLVLSVLRQSSLYSLVLPLHARGTANTLTTADVYIPSSVAGQAPSRDRRDSRPY